jgi:hypothetical protein
MSIGTNSRGMILAHDAAILSCNCSSPTAWIYENSDSASGLIATSIRITGSRSLFLGTTTNDVFQ